MTMTSADMLPAAVLKRKRRQYELVDVARRRGFRDVEVIDDDLGRSASGMVALARLRAAGGVALCRGGRGRIVLRRVPARPQRSRLASPARTLRPGRGARHRPRRGL